MFFGITYSYNIYVETISFYVWREGGRDKERKREIKVLRI
jgi:hypothetical protein